MRKNEKFIISEHTNVATAGHKNWNYYSAYNFVVDSLGNLYIHNKDTILNLNTGTDFYYPNWLDLKTSDFRKVNLDTFKSTVDKVLKLTATRKNSIQISALYDTVNAASIMPMLEIVKNKGFGNYILRLSTEEEKEVLKARIYNKKYNFYKINWKIRFACQCFPPPLSEE